MSESAVSEAPASVSPKARSQAGWVSAAYFPKQQTRKNDGKEFTAHDIAIRHSYRDSAGQIQHKDLTIPRSQALNLVLCLQDVVRQSYEFASADDSEQ